MVGPRQTPPLHIHRRSEIYFLSLPQSANYKSLHRFRLFFDSHLPLIGYRDRGIWIEDLIKAPSMRSLLWMRSLATSCRLITKVDKDFIHYIHSLDATYCFYSFFYILSLISLDVADVVDCSRGDQWLIEMKPTFLLLPKMN